MNNKLKIFLEDSIIKRKYNINDEKLQSISMTSKEDNIMVVLIRELIMKQSEEATERIAASRLNQILDHRLSKGIERKKNENS